LGEAPDREVVLPRCEEVKLIPILGARKIWRKGWSSNEFSL
jgi:hypothetical protein